MSTDSPFTYVHDPLKLALAPLPRRQTARTPDLSESSLPLWTNGRDTRAGYWDCTPGQFDLHCDGYTEICQLLSGTVTVQEDGGEPVTLHAGDSLVMASGWRGSCHVENHVRKLFVIVSDQSN